jgi:hypothetical protein
MVFIIHNQLLFNVECSFLLSLLARFVTHNVFHLLKFKANNINNMIIDFF